MRIPASSNNSQTNVPSATLPRFLSNLTMIIPNSLVCCSTARGIDQEHPWVHEAIQNNAKQHEFRPFAFSRGFGLFCVISWIGSLFLAPTLSPLTHCGKFQPALWRWWQLSSAIRLLFYRPLPFVR